MTVKILTKQEWEDKYGPCPNEFIILTNKLINVSNKEDIQKEIGEFKTDETKSDKNGIY